MASQHALAHMHATLQALCNKCRASSGTGLHTAHTCMRWDTSSWYALLNMGTSMSTAHHRNRPACAGTLTADSLALAPARTDNRNITTTCLPMVSTQLHWLCLLWPKPLENNTDGPTARAGGGGAAGVRSNGGSGALNGTQASSGAPGAGGGGSGPTGGGGGTGLQCFLQEGAGGLNGPGGGGGCGGPGVVSGDVGNGGAYGGGAAGNTGAPGGRSAKGGGGACRVAWGPGARVVPDT